MSIKLTQLVKNKLRESDQKRVVHDEEPIEDPKAQPVEEPKEQSEDPLRSNIDQFWMNPADLKNDLYKFLAKIQGEDPELARQLISNIRAVISKFRYKPERPVDVN